MENKSSYDLNFRFNKVFIILSLHGYVAFIKPSFYFNISDEHFQLQLYLYMIIFKMYQAFLYIELKIVRSHGDSLGIASK